MKIRKTMFRPHPWENEEGIKSHGKKLDMKI